jgi:8-oxo-dGTP pyrophosphatase MutT (NUDIX family)
MKESAGLVIIYDDKILLVHPTGSKWWGTYSIPKGHIEEGEDHLEAAIRETEEETGLKISEYQTNPENEGYINYRDEHGNLYKRIYFYVIRLKNSINIDKSKLQKEEVDWIGFLTKEEAEKRIFWRFKSLLKLLK